MSFEAYWFFAGGVVLLLLGSEAIVRGGVALSRAFGIPPLPVGLLIVGAGSAVPELAVSAQAAYAGAPAIALGNVLGSNLLGLLLILGAAGLIRPLAASPKIVLRDGGAMIAAALALVLMASDGRLTRLDGAILLAMLFGYLGVTYLSDWRRTIEHSVPSARAVAKLEASGGSESAGIFLLLFGLALLAVGARFTVAGAEGVARQIGISEAMIGLTLVALATSLPEIALTLVAVSRGETQIAVGQFIAAAIFNSLGVLGLTAVLRPLAVDSALMPVFVVLLAVAAILPVLLVSGWRLTRPRAVLLIVLFGGYLAYLLFGQGLIAL